MTNDRERLRIREARYVPGKAYEDAVERTLQGLPLRRRKGASGVRRVAAACAAVAACVLVLVPVVQAAAPMIGQLFQDVIARIEARQALPEDARFTEALAQREAWIRTHAVSGETEFEGAKISLIAMAFMRGDSDADGSKPDGILELRIRYDRIPAFDPNYTEFTVRYNGRVYKTPPDGNLDEYRAEGNHARTIADWRNIGTYGPSGYSELEAGVPETLIRFQVNPWKLDQNTEIVLEGVQDGKVFSLPFSFDPALAHESAIEAIRASLPGMEEMDVALKEYVTALGEAASDLDMQGVFRGVRYQLSQVAVNEGDLVIGWTVEREDGEPVEISAGMSDFYVDGYPLPSYTSSIIDDQAGTRDLITRKQLALDMGKRPEQSLIALQLYVDDSGAQTPLVFRYNWAKNQAIAPKDDAELAEWLKEADALAADVQAAHPESIRYAIDAAPQTDAGITVTLYRADVSWQGIELYYKSVAQDAEGLHLAPAWRDHPTLTLDGAEARGVGETGLEDDLGYFFSLPVYFSELREGATCDFSLSLELTDDTDTVVRTGNFHWTFGLDPERIIP